MKIKVNFLLISLVSFFILILNVSANTVNLNEFGSIEITLRESTNSIKGAEISLYHVADVIKIDNNLVFKLKNELACNVDLNDLTKENLTKEILDCNLDNTTKLVEYTDINGIARFNNLKLGLYLAKQTKSVKGYFDIDSFLVVIPKVEDSNWIYDVKAKPKTDICKSIDIVVEKKWNSNSNNLPNDVTIELYEENLLVDTVKLNADNNWTYKWENMKLSDKYSVKEINVPKGFTPSYKVNEYIFTVTNTDILANTGQIFYPIIIFFIVGIVFVLTGIIIIKKGINE